MKFKKSQQRLQRRIKDYLASLARMGAAKAAGYKCPGSRKR